MSNHSHAGSQPKATEPARGHYVRLVVMIVLSFIAMYFLMYAMIDRADNFYANLNQFYMAGLMAAAMTVIELGLMFGMYPNKRLNVVIIAAGVIALALFWSFTRRQTAIADKQFLRSMIPHHASAILMCQRAPIQDAEIRRLCQEIVSGQQREIDQMKARLRDLGG